MPPPKKEIAPRASTCRDCLTSDETGQSPLIVVSRDVSREGLCEGLRCAQTSPAVRIGLTSIMFYYRDLSPVVCIWLGYSNGFSLKIF
jgi:hypothetical protein